MYYYNTVWVQLFKPDRELWSKANNISLQLTWDASSSIFEAPEFAFLKKWYDHFCFTYCLKKYNEQKLLFINAF